MTGWQMASNREEIVGGLLAAHEKLPPNELRLLGAQDFRLKGLPHPKRDESWRYTSLKALRGDYRWRGEEGEGETPFNPPFPLLPQRIVFSNGRPCPNLTALEEGCWWEPFTDGKFLSSHLEKQDGFMGLAMAYCPGVHRLHITKKLKSPLGIYHFLDGDFEGAMAHPLFVVEAQEGTEGDLLEVVHSTGELKSALYNSHSLFQVERGSDIEHVRVFQLDGGVLPFSHVQANVAGQASYRNTALVLGGNFLRNNVQVKLLEEEAETSLNGLFLHAENEDSSHYSLIDHRAPQTFSKQLYKGILDHRSHASFHGTVVVGENCPEVESAQLNKNLLLSKTARVDSCPQLEIANCDVKCTHGSTTGQLDPNQIFYLQARGIPREQARRLLVHAFGEDVVDKIKREDIRSLGREFSRRRHEL